MFAWLRHYAHWLHTQWPAGTVERLPVVNPDFTTKEQGLGLGLALAHEMIQAHGGEIRVRSIWGVGTTFDILLPVKGDIP